MKIKYIALLSTTLVALCIITWQFGIDALAYWVAVGLLILACKKVSSVAEKIEQKEKSKEL